MEKQNTLIDLLKTFLKDYERIDKIDETLPSIYSYISDKIHFNNNSTFPSSIPSGLTDNIEGDANQIFWVQRIANLLKIFNDNFKILETDEDETKKEEYLSYAENMKIIKNRQRINVEDLNDNFKLISTGFKLITDELFGTAIAKNNKYLVMFNGIAKELIPLWENVLYLWLSFLLKEREKIEKPIVIFAYLNESQLINHQKFDGKKINLNVQDGIDINYILDRIECYIDEFPNSHLCVIPIIRQLTDQKYYGEECYPGIFYHAPNFNSQLLKCDRKFMYYPFRDMGTKGHDEYEPFNPFQPSIIFHFERRFLRAGFLNTISDDSDSYLQLGDVSYGYRIYGDHLYYAAPYNNIPNIKEIIPKKYYSAVKSFVSGSFFIDNGVLMISDFAINYQDMVGYNVDRTANNNIVAQYKPDIDNANYLCLSLDDALANTNERYVLKEAIFMKSEKTEVNSHTLTKVRNFRDRIAKNSSFKFQYFDSSCISGQTKSVEEDYSYLIEYIPLKYEQYNSGENSWVRESSMNTLKTYVDSNLKTKDNDLLKKHVVWDDERNNILEDKFVLRIGQHIEADAVPAHSELIPDDFKFEDSIKYFDYKSTLNHDIEEKTSGTVKYYNNGTTEVGAYLNIPFIKNPKKRLQFYPEFLSHSFGSDNLVPLNSIEYFDKTQTNKPEYFSYNKVFRDYPIKKNVYFQIYTSDGKEHFENDNWCVQIIEVISQATPQRSNFIPDNFNIENVQTMDSLYTSWSNLSSAVKEQLIENNVLPFVTQICPSDVSGEATAEVMNPELYNWVQQKYSKIVNYFYPNYSTVEKQRIYNTIFNSLFNTTFNMHDPVNHLIHEKVIEYNSSTKKNEDNIIKQIGNIDDINSLHPSRSAHNTYDLKLQLGIYNKNATETELNDWEKAIMLPDSSGLTIENSGNECHNEFLKPTYTVSKDTFYILTLGVIKFYYYHWDWDSGQDISEFVANPDTNKIYYNISDWETYGDLTTRYSPGETFSPTQMRFATYKNGNWIIDSFYYTDIAQAAPDTSLINYYTISPQIKNNTKKPNGAGSQYLYDETYKGAQYTNNLIIGSKFLVAGFCCANRTIPIMSSINDSAVHDPDYTGLRDILHYEKDASKVIRFEIFGANIPLWTKYWNLSTSNAQETAWHAIGVANGATPKIAMSPQFKSDKSSDYWIPLITKASLLNPTNAVWLRNASVTREYKLDATDVGKLATLNSKAKQHTSQGDEREELNPYYYTFIDSTNTLAPFYNFFFYPLLRYTYITKRQYPHLYLMNQYTLFPNKNYLSNMSNRNINYKSINRNNQLNTLKDYFKNFKIKNIQAKDIPYPLPQEKITTTYNKIEGDIDWDKDDCIKRIKKIFITDAKKDLNNIFQETVYTAGSLTPTDIEYHVSSSHGTETYAGETHSVYYGGRENIEKNKICFPSADIYFLTQRLGQDCVKYDNKSIIAYSGSTIPIKNRLEDYTYVWRDTNILGVTSPTTPIQPQQDTVYKGSTEENFNDQILYEESKETGEMNLQIIIHYLGPNGKYARRVMTRTIDSITPNSNYFTWKGDVNALIYNEWTNIWNNTYHSDQFSTNNHQSNYEWFKNHLGQIFKQSGNMKYVDGDIIKTLDFETYPNNGKTM